MVDFTIQMSKLIESGNKLISPMLFSGANHCKRNKKRKHTIKPATRMFYTELKLLNFTLLKIFHKILINNH